MKFTSHKFFKFICFYLVFFFVTEPIFAQMGFTQQSNTRQQGGSTTGKTTRDETSVPSLGQSEIVEPTFQSPQSLSENNILGPKINVHVLGEVLNPGIYTVDVSSRLSNVLNTAIPKRPAVRLVEVRNPNEKTRVYDLYRYFYNADLRNNPFLKENDVIFVPPHKGAVRVEGPITRPGLYELLNEKTLADVLKLSGGITNSASTIYPIKVLRFSEQGKQFITDVENTASAKKKFKVLKGDIIVVPDMINDPKKFDYTVESIPGENLFYPTATPSIFVLGQVSQAGSYPYKSHLRIKDYVSYASPTPQARLNKVQLIRDGKKMNLKFDERPNPGDILVIKSKYNPLNTVTVVSTLMSFVLTTLLLKATLENL